MFHGFDFRGKPTPEKNQKGQKRNGTQPIGFRQSDLLSRLQEKALERSTSVMDVIVPGPSYGVERRSAGQWRLGYDTGDSVQCRCW